MKIAILTTVHPPLDVRVFHKEARSLSQAGHAITLFAPFDDRAELLTGSNNIAYISLGKPSGRLNRPKLWYRLFRLLADKDFDVWHFHDPELLPLVVIWRTILGKNVRLVYDVHEDLPKDILDKPWISRLLRKPVSKIADIIESVNIKKCNLVIAATDSIGKHISHSTNRYVIVRNYPITHDDNIERGMKNGCGPVKIIYEGTLTEIRGVKQVVQAMDFLDGKDVELILLGKIAPNSFEAEIRKISGKNVQIIGVVPFEEVPIYLSSSDIGIVNFLPLPNHIESMPNKLFEYMQAELPVIASNFPLWKEIIDSANCGITVDPERPEDIALGISKLVHDPDLRKHMGKAAKNAVLTMYSWQFEARTLLSAYEILSHS